MSWITTRDGVFARCGPGSQLSLDSVFMKCGPGSQERWYNNCDNVAPWNNGLFQTLKHFMSKESPVHQWYDVLLDHKLHTQLDFWTMRKTYFASSIPLDPGQFVACFDCLEHRFAAKFPSLYAILLPLQPGPAAGHMKLSETLYKKQEKNTYWLKPDINTSQIKLFFGRGKGID